MNNESHNLTRHNVVTLNDTKRRIDTYLKAAFDQRIEQAAHLSQDYAQLWQSIATLSAAGGKRLRPYMTILSYTMNGDSRQLDAIIPAAAAQELLHLALLIHDDIIDRDDQRYGIKNVTGQYNDLYAEYIADDTERRHFSNSAAIIAGDLLISEAFRLIQQCDVDSARIAQAQVTIADAVFHVAGGELLDTESSFRSHDRANALLVAQQKTASYSFVSPLVMGAYLAGSPDETIEALRQFGDALGTAYQLQDDLLDVFGDELLTGKSTSSDIVEGKYTYLIEQFHRLASDDQKKQFEAIFKNQHADTKMLDQARQLLITSGAQRATGQAISDLTSRAQKSLTQLELSESHQRSFAALIDRCTNRSS